MNVAVWPTSIVTAAGVILTIGLTLTETVAAVEFTFVPVLSVTWIINSQLPTAVEPEVSKVKLAEPVPTVT